MSVTLTINDIPIWQRKPEPCYCKLPKKAGSKFLPSVTWKESVMLAACRLCLVEVVGSSKLLPACVTEVSEGMQVIPIPRTASLSPHDRRAIVLRRESCLCGVCGKWQLRTARSGDRSGHGSYSLSLSIPPTRHRRIPSQFGIDHNRCVLCTRCVTGVR
jgi:bidirectional [NiFe] hydrogenase diaphorase subunit